MQWTIGWEPLLVQQRNSDEKEQPKATPQALGGAEVNSLELHLLYGCSADWSTRVGLLAVLHQSSKRWTNILLVACGSYAEVTDCDRGASGARDKERAASGAEDRERAGRAQLLNGHVSMSARGRANCWSCVVVCSQPAWPAHLLTDGYAIIAGDYRPIG